MRFFTLLVGVAGLPLLAAAGSISYIGTLDPNNPNDVFQTTFQVTGSGFVDIQSWGYGGSAGGSGGMNAAGQVIPGGGFDPYLSLFTGSGPTATFLASNDDGICPPGTPAPGCFDSTLIISLSAGTYTVALTQPFNFSFAENTGTGNLGDGFIGLASDYGGQTSAYAFDIKGETVQTTPEPATSVLVAAAVGLLLLAVKRSRAEAPRG